MTGTSGLLLKTLRVVVFRFEQSVHELVLKKNVLYPTLLFILEFDRRGMSDSRNLNLRCRSRRMSSLRKCLARSYGFN